MKFRLGLTGSIGMGKSTTANMFAEAGCRVWDADMAVHRLYAAGGAAVEPMSQEFSDAIEGDAVSRARLREIITEDPTALPRIEKIVHPLVQSDREEFALAHPDAIGVFDIPLLFETGGEAAMDAVACVTVSPEIQKARVLARGTMTEDQLRKILSNQMPIAEKIRRSDYVIRTETLEGAQAQVYAVLKDIRRRIGDA